MTVDEDCICYKDSNGTRTCPIHTSVRVRPRPRVFKLGRTWMAYGSGFYTRHDSQSEAFMHLYKLIYHTGTYAI